METSLVKPITKKTVTVIKKMENILKNLKHYEAKIKEIDLKIADLKDMQYLSVKGINYENFIKTNQVFSKTESQVLKDFEIDEMIDLIEFEKRHIHRFIQRVYNAMESLTDIEKSILTMKYIDRKIWRYITFEVNIEERRCRQIKNDALKKMYRILKGHMIEDENVPKKC